MQSGLIMQLLKLFGLLESHPFIMFWFGDFQAFEYVSLPGGAGVSQLIKLTEEEYIAFLNDFDPIESPPNNYKIQPENQGFTFCKHKFWKNLNLSDLGKLIWITGPPGTGKSTTAQCLARDHGYVYYEADCFASLKESRNMRR